jgi:hypothetical protein
VKWYIKRKRAQQAKPAGKAIVVSALTDASRSRQGFLGSLVEIGEDVEEELEENFDPGNSNFFL